MEHGPAIAGMRAHQRLRLRRTEIRGLADTPYIRLLRNTNCALGGDRDPVRNIVPHFSFPPAVPRLGAAAPFL
jgi:hypothetical protein